MKNGRRPDVDWRGVEGKCRCGRGQSEHAGIGVPGVGNHGGCEASGCAKFTFVGWMPGKAPRKLKAWVGDHNSTHSAVIIARDRKEAARLEECSVYYLDKFWSQPWDTYCDWPEVCQEGGPGLYVASGVASNDYKKISQEA